MSLVGSHEHFSGSQTPAIIVYPNRRGITVWLLLVTVSCLLSFLICIFVLIVILVFPAAHYDGAIMTAVLMGGSGFAALWPIRVLAHLLSSGEPMLVITHQGIQVGKLYGPSEIVLPWAEIEAVSRLGGGIQKQLALRPRDIAGFLSHFNPPLRFFLRVNLMRGAPIAIAQSFLEKPIDEILQQVQILYAHELDAYHIRLSLS